MRIGLYGKAEFNIQKRRLQMERALKSWYRELPCFGCTLHFIHILATMLELVLLAIALLWETEVLALWGQDDWCSGLKKV